ncbi:MAG: LysM peptidoglycan-binding domain-containing protein [Gammaproteobacteria bacterium]|nr:LysM peptidoglycan-binding domain-containing protein [Gammaproteobacteria bacterium]
MGNLANVPTARLVLAVSLSMALGACAVKRDGVVVVEAPTKAEDRFGSDEMVNHNYTTSIPLNGVRVSRDDLRTGTEQNYTVVRGDTLWDISGKFLNSPWLWPEIWDFNPQIENPHLIYPGDNIALEYVDGQPTLILSRNGEAIGSGSAGAGDGAALSTSGTNTTSGAARLSPRIRQESLANAVPTIPGDAIAQFLIRPQVVPASTLRNAPYVIGNDDGRLISALGHQIYVRGLKESKQTSYGIFRRSKTLRDPVTNDILGYEVLHVAEAKLMHAGDPATLAITSNKMETIAGDVLLPSTNEGLEHTYIPRLPSLSGAGRIISLVDAISQSGRNQIVVLNLGKESGIQVGDVLAVEGRGGAIIDSFGKRRFERVKMPNKRTGVVMVFQTFDEVSYALVMESSRPVALKDYVTGI